jgi:hypothetical protein
MTVDIDNENLGTPRGGWNLQGRIKPLHKSGDLFFDPVSKESFVLLNEVIDVIFDEDLSDDFMKYDKMEFAHVRPSICELLHEGLIVKKMSVDLKKFTKI